MATFRYKHPIEETFHPKNSNYTQAKAAAKSVAKRLMAKGPEKVRQYNDQIKKGIKDKTFVWLSDEEVAGLSKVPHHYTFHSAVFSASKVRLVNNTSTCIPTQMATITTEQECPRKALNNQLLVLYRHAIWDTPILSDISTCYRSMLPQHRSYWSIGIPIVAAA